MENSKPCPFCGGTELNVKKYDDGETAYYTVVCETCWAKGPDAFAEAQAWIFWNKLREK